LFRRFVLSPHCCCCPIVCWCHHRQNSHQHLAIALLLPLPCQCVIVTAPSHTPSSPHHRSCCTIAVAIAASQLSHCCSHSATASPMQFPTVLVLHHCSACLTIDLLQHRHDVVVPHHCRFPCHLGDKARPGGFSKNDCCNAGTAPAAVLPGGGRAMSFPYFCCSCPRLIVAFHCCCRQQGTVRELLQICCSNAATAPTAAPPGDGRVTPFPFLLLQLPLVDCRFLFVFLGNKASPNMAAATPPLRQLPGDGRVMPFFLYLLQLPPVN